MKRKIIHFSYDPWPWLKKKKYNNIKFTASSKMKNKTKFSNIVNTQMGEYSDGEGQTQNHAF